MRNGKRENWFKETQFQKFFVDKGGLECQKPRRYCTLISTEFRLFSPMSLLKKDVRGIMGNTTGAGMSNDVIGKIDVIFRYSSQCYAGEIKWTIPRSDFWSALKIMGYCVYYNWQNETWGGFDPALPAILIPLNHIKLEHKIVANKLKVALFGIIKEKKGYRLELVNP